MEIDVRKTITTTTTTPTKVETEDFGASIVKGTESVDALYAGNKDAMLPYAREIRIAMLFVPIVERRGTRNPTVGRNAEKVEG